MEKFGVGEIIMENNLEELLLIILIKFQMLLKD
jgi:hypothetical protein